MSEANQPLGGDHQRDDELFAIRPVTEMQYLPPNDASAVDAQALAERVVNVLFAVLAADTSFEELAWQR